jgi:uncharacterized membrane protein YdcZ (DUF606 family)
MATVRLQLRRGTADDWFDADPTLAAGEIGIETDTNTFKFGDGETPWNDLEYALSGTVDDYIELSTKGVAGGVASLDSSGFVPTSQLPPLAKITVSAVADQAARLALTAETGDIAIQADSGQSYVLSASPASTDANWKALTGTEAVVDTVEAALVTGTGLDKTYNDESGTITIDIDSTVATKTYADQAEADAISTAAADATSKANAAQAAAEGYADSAIGVLTSASPESLNTLAELAAALGDDANFASTVTNSLASKAPLASPTFTGTVTLPELTTLASPTLTGTVTLSESTSIGDVSNLEIGYLNGVTSSLQTQIDAKLESSTASSTYAPLASPTLTGTVTLPATTSIGDVSNLEIGYLNGVTSSLQTQIDAKLETSTASSTYAPLASPTLTGTVTLPESTSIGDVSNQEIGYLNGVTSGVQTQIDAKAPLESPTLTGTVTLSASTSIGDVSNLEIGYLNGVTSALQTQLDDKSPLASPTFTGTVTLPADTITQSMMSDDSVGTAEIIASSVTSSELAIDAVTEAKIASGAVTSAKIADDTIVDADINSAAAIGWTKLAVSSTVSETELGYLDGVTSAVQTQIDAVPGLISTAKGEAIADATAQVAAVLDSAPAALDTLNELAAALGDDANFASTVTTALDGKVASYTPISQKTDSYTLSATSERDTLIEMGKATAQTLTIPTHASVAFPVGASLDILQTGAGAVTIEGAGGVTVNGTPGLKLRTQWSSATLFKRAENSWIVMGDLSV